MRHLSAFVLLAAFSVCYSSLHRVQYCSSAEQALDITHLDISPSPVTVWHKVTVDVYGTTRVEIQQGARVEIVIKAVGITLYSESYDLCDSFGPGVVCPMPAESGFTAALKFTIPSYAPAGVTTNTRIVISNSAGHTLGCFSVDMDTKKAKSLWVNNIAEMEFLFDQWRKQYHGATKFEPAEEYVYRLSIFSSYHAKIMEQNTRNSSLSLSHTVMSHLTDKEVLRYFDW